MKKIGVLFGQENSFPMALVECVNARGVKNIAAEWVRIDWAAQALPTDYAVILDRISQDVPFYRAYLKNAAMTGTAVLNNPFWWSADDKFFNNCLAETIDVAVPRTVILPSHDHPPDTNAQSFRNLAYPLDWEAIFRYVGFPAYFKPFAGGGWKHVYRVTGREEFFQKYAETGQLVMMLQEEIVFEEYFRCYCLGGSKVRVMQYDPRQPHPLRYLRNAAPVPPALMKRVEADVKKLNRWLGYDFNTVEMAVRGGTPYAIDFCNPAPDADVRSIGEENFEWVVQHAADLVIARAQAAGRKKHNLTWGKFIAAAATREASRP
jgi:hypothetical protein